MAVLSKIPLDTISLIVINAAIFAIEFLTDSQSQIIRNYGFIPGSLFNADGLTEFNNQQNGDNGFLSSLVRMFTSMFIHANIAHIAFNLAALAYMGGFAEKAIGIPRYLSVYFLSGMFAAFFHGIIASYLLNNGQVLLVRASGAISGIFGMSAALGNRQTYYWLVFQIVFAFLGSVSSIPIAFTANVVAGQPVKAISVNKQLLANLGNGQALYSVDLGERMSGTTPNKGTQSTLNDNINTLLLWNDAGRSVKLVADNNLALNIVSHR
ncbi:MAG: rhomboid family intramembrane serine protease [Candidatus Nitrosocosmicus sp.]